MEIQGNSPLKSTETQEIEKNKVPSNELRWEAPGSSKLVENSG